MAAGAERIDEMMDKASDLLVKTKYFEAEKLAAEALQLARDEDEFERMARIIMPLQEARRQRLLKAFATKALFIIDHEEELPEAIEPGCYLLQPMLVGADARRLRIAALEAKVPVAVLAREPITQLRQQPIVAIAPGLTIRAKIELPEDVEEPELEWYIRALEELGDGAISSLDPEMDVIRRIDALLLRLEAHPDHEGLHQALREACEEALEKESADKGGKKNSGGQRSRAQAEL